MLAVIPRYRQPVGVVNWPHHIFVNQDFTVVGAD
jgi:hypothetical protein